MNEGGGRRWKTGEGGWWRLRADALVCDCGAMRAGDVGGLVCGCGAVRAAPCAMYHRGVKV